VGQAVLCALEQRALGPGVELVDGGTPGLNTVLLLEGRSRVIVIDAADFGACPGNVRRFELTANDLSLQPVHSNSLHAAGLLEALALATALGVLPAQVALYGVQPRTLDYDTELSREVRAAIPALVDLIVQELARP
jgi:hydrogenase maturation protease